MQAAMPLSAVCGPCKVGPCKFGDFILPGFFGSNCRALSTTYAVYSHACQVCLQSEQGITEAVDSRSEP